MRVDGFLILDWAGNVLYNGEKFQSFNDGWDRLFADAPDDCPDSYFEDFQVLPVSEVSQL